MALPIVYRDEHLIAINKPHGLLVHRTSIAADAKVFALQELRNQIERPVYPAHRIDRKTGGVLLFALNPDTHRWVQQLFADGHMKKKYLAIVRGYTQDKGEIDHPLMREDGKRQEALTAYSTLARAELDVPLGKYNTSRYSLVLAEPKTGRMHQIRKHFNHLRHPIIGDRPHGCSKQNRLFKENWQMDTMLLHALSLYFIHPKSKAHCHIMALPMTEFMRVAEIMGWKELLIKYLANENE